MKQDLKSKQGMGGMGRGGFGSMGKPAQKAKDFSGTLKRLLTYFKPERKLLAIILSAALLGTTFNIVGPKILGKATTKLFENLVASFIVQVQNQSLPPAQQLPVPGIEFGYIGQIILTLLILYVISAIFTFVQQYLMAGVTQRTVYTLRKQVDEKLAKLPLRYYDSHSHGDILSRTVNDLDTVGSTLQQSISQLITSTTTLVGVLVMMLSISVTLTIVSILTLPLSGIIIAIIAKKSQTFFKAQQKALGNLNGHVEEMYNGHVIVKAFNHEEKAITIFNDLNNALYDSGWKAQFMSGIIMPMMRFIGNIGYVLVAIAGGIMATQGAITIGDVQAFIQYSNQFTQPIIQLANIANLIQSAIASAERIFELLDEKEELPDASKPMVIKNPKGKVVFDHVQFGYNKGEVLMKDIDINIKPGQMVAIVGPTGAGKTTLVNLLMRFYEVNKGKILIDGVDITKMKRSYLRNMIGMVLQDTWLFHGTLKENIAYGREDATEKEIIEASKAAHADHFIRTLPDGYDMILNEEASNVSQGQKQLLTIARAFLADPKILILDEATSSVDTRTEELIQTAMEKLMKNRTSFVIAHRLSTIKNADLILVMDHGTIIEQGTHKKLMTKKGFYAELYNSQFNE